MEAVEVTLDTAAEVWSTVLRRPHQDSTFDDRSRRGRQRRRGRHRTAAVGFELLSEAVLLDLCTSVLRVNKKHLKNAGPIRHCESPHAHSPGVASGTVARRLRIDVHDNNDDSDNA